MARLTELATRLKRLLSGDFRHEDLTFLLLGLRERCYGFHSIRELGDFIAHRDIRNKGPIADHVRMFFRIIRMNHEIKKIDGVLDRQNLHRYIADIVKHNLKRPESHQILKRLQIKRTVAQNIISKFVASLREDSGQTQATEAFSEQDWLLINDLTLQFSTEQGFYEDQLWSDFCTVLAKNGLVHETNIVHKNEIKNLFSLFVLTLLHGIKIEIDLDWYAFLYLADDSEELIIRTLAEIPHYRPRRQFSFNLFSTSLRKSEWCFACEFSSRDEIWSKAFEIDRNMKLRVVE